MPALPSPPTRAYSFTDYSTSTPTLPPPGDKLDAEIDRTNAALADTIAFVSTLFTPAGALKPNSVPPEALTADLADQLQQIDLAAQTLADQRALQWAEYLAGPIVDQVGAPAYIAGSAFPAGLYGDAVQGGSGGLFSAKYWAIAAMTAVTQFTQLYGAPSPPPVIQIIPVVAWTFNNATTAFPLVRRDNGQTITPDQSALLVFLNGYLQVPGTDFTVAGSTITFAQAPPADIQNYAVWLSPQQQQLLTTLDAGTF